MSGKVVQAVCVVRREPAPRSSEAQAVVIREVVLGMLIGLIRALIIIPKGSTWFIEDVVFHDIIPAATAEEKHPAPGIAIEYIMQHTAIRAAYDYCILCMAGNDIVRDFEPGRCGVGMHAPTGGIGDEILADDCVVRWAINAMIKRGMSDVMDVIALNQKMMTSMPHFLDTAVSNILDVIVENTATQATAVS